MLLLRRRSMLDFSRYFQSTARSSRRYDANGLMALNIDNFSPV